MISALEQLKTREKSQNSEILTSGLDVQVQILEKYFDSLLIDHNSNFTKIEVKFEEKTTSKNFTSSTDSTSTIQAKVSRTEREFACTPKELIYGLSSGVAARQIQTLMIASEVIVSPRFHLGGIIST